MTFSKQLLYLTTLLVLTWNCCYGNSLSIIVPPLTQDCLYMQKEPGERMLVDIQITEGRKIGIRLIGPRQEVIHDEEKVDGLRLNEKVSAPGEYAFCFLNSHSYTEPVTVHFEYDMFEEDEEGRFNKQLKAEKRKFLLKQIDRMKPTNQVARASNAYEVGEETVDNSTLAGLKETLIILSLNLEMIDSHMRTSTAKMAHSHYIQKQNNSWVLYFSFTICVLIVVMGCIQVIVLKGLFNGKISFKVWQF